MQPIPLYIEVVGEPGVGKSHYSYNTPKPAVIDTTTKKEGQTLLRKFYPDEWEKRYFPVWTMDDIRKAIVTISQNRSFFRTIVIDTAADLRELATAEWCLKNKRQRPQPFEYGDIDDAVNSIIDVINSFPRPGTPETGNYLRMNLVMIAQMKDEYLDNKNTGRRIRKGFPKSNFQADIRLYFDMVDILDTNTQQPTGKQTRRVRIIKSRFLDKASDQWIAELKPTDWKTTIEKLTDLKPDEVVQ